MSELGKMIKIIFEKINTELGKTQKKTIDKIQD